MGASRTLLRKLDLDLIARIEASGRPEKPKRTLKGKLPRVSSSYRGARRNAARGFVWRGADARREHAGSTDLNRSQRWPRAKSYAHAREIGPSSEIVR